MARRRVLLTSTLINAVWTTLVQGIAILMLTPFEYGQFAAVYILFAVLNIFVLAVVSDAWARANNRGASPAGWSQYSSALVLLLVISSILLVPILLIMGLGLLTIPLSIAILSAAYRGGARYYAVSSGSGKFLVAPDVVAVIAMLLVYLLLRLSVPELSAICWAWAAGSLGSAVMSRRPSKYSAGGSKRWLARHAGDIKLLLFDSFAVEGASLGIPLLLAGMMGPARFGIYRSISSTGIPIRLVLNPIRPLLTKRSPQFFTKPKVLFAVCCCGLALGGGVFALLSLISGLDLVEGSTLAELSSYALLASVYVACNLVSSFYYISNRTHLTGRRVVMLRILQSSVSVVGPLAGYFLGMLDGAIAGFVLAAFINSALSVLAAYASPGRRRSK